MSRNDHETLLSRWSRLKRESAATGGGDTLPATRETAEAEAGRNAQTGNKADSVRAAKPLPELPSLDDLNPASDFQAFMDPRVDDGVRRAALKTLFHSPEFNVCDGLDVYAEDYTKLERLTPAMVAALRYAQRTLFGKQEQREDKLNAADDTAWSGVEKTSPLEQRSAGDSVTAGAQEISDRVQVPETESAESAPDQTTGNESLHQQAVLDKKHSQTRTS